MSLFYVLHHIYSTKKIESISMLHIKGLRAKVLYKKVAFQVGSGGPRLHRAKMKDGEKQALSQPLTADAALGDVTRESDSDRACNSLLFLSETTTPAPPDIVLHSCASKVITYAQHTLRVYALVLVSIIYFPQFTKNMGRMSREKLKKIEDFAKNFYL